MFESPGVRKWRSALRADESTLNLGEVGIAAEKIDQLVCKAHTREIQRATVVVCVRVCVGVRVRDLLSRGKERGKEARKMRQEWQCSVP